MQTLKVIISWSGECYGAQAPEVLGCVSVENSLEDVKRTYAEALELHREGSDPGELPEWIERGQYTLAFELDATALLKHYSNLVPLAAIARISGIQAPQLSHYLAGRRIPRPDKRAKILQALHYIGGELLKAE